MFQVFYAFAVMLITTEIGQRFNLAYAECNDMVEQFDWYLFPTDIQRMLPMILNFTQQPFEIICFGSAACDRNTFKSVSKFCSMVNTKNQFKSTRFKFEFLLGNQNGILILYGSSEILQLNRKLTKNPKLKIMLHYVFLKLNG